MPRVYIGIGTNIDREHNLRAGVRALREHFGSVDLSTVYETEAIGFEGDNFYNMVVGVNTDLTAQQVYETLHAIEYEHGRDRKLPRYSSRTLDLDLLLYDDQVLKTDDFEIPRHDVNEYPFVLAPLAELDGQRRHPVTGKTFTAMWAEFDKSRLGMWPVSVTLDED